MAALARRAEKRPAQRQVSAQRAEVKRGGLPLEAAVPHVLAASQQPEAFVGQQVPGVLLLQAVVVQLEASPQREVEQQAAAAEARLGAALQQEVAQQQGVTALQPVEVQLEVLLQREVGQRAPVALPRLEVAKLAAPASAGVALELELEVLQERLQVASLAPYLDQARRPGPSQHAPARARPLV